MFSKLGQQFLNFWRGQSVTQRMVLIALVTAGAILIALFVTWANTPSYAVAFAGLSEADAGQIVEALAADNIPYQIKASGTIQVASDQVHEVRLRMARQGLPQSGTVGFELFSGTNLGMTEFSQRVNYQQALEGELERTIGSLQSIDAVRVHIVTPAKALFASDQAPTTASITVKINPSAQLGSAQVRAITHLVASSVENLRAENIVLVDVEGNLLASGSGEGFPANMSAQTDSRLASESGYSLDIENKVRNLLTSALGPNRSVVQASVVMDWTERETTTQSYDPDTSVIRSSQIISESYGADADIEGGVPGAETNLPLEEIEEQATGSEGSSYQRREEVINFEITETQSREVRVPGNVVKISLSVLVDGVTEQEDLTILQAAIVAALGIDAERGDLLEVDTLDFDRSYYEEQATALEKIQSTDLYSKIGTAVVGVLLLVGLGFYIMRLLSNLRLASAEAWTPIMEPVSRAALTNTGATMALSGGGAGSAKGSNRAMAPPRAIMPTANELELQQLAAELAEEKPASIAEIIHIWLSEDEA